MFIWLHRPECAVSLVKSLFLTGAPGFLNVINIIFVTECYGTHRSIWHRSIWQFSGKAHPDISAPKHPLKNPTSAREPAPSVHGPVLFFLESEIFWSLFFCQQLNPLSARPWV